MNENETSTKSQMAKELEFDSRHGERFFSSP
jgi:hypothetical protein